MKNSDQLRYDDDWEADWEGHRRWQLTAGLAATPAQRLAWLEEMIGLAHQHTVNLDAKSDRPR